MGLLFMVYDFIISKKSERQNLHIYFNIDNITSSFTCFFINLDSDDSSISGTGTWIMTAVKVGQVSNSVTEN